MLRYEKLILGQMQTNCYLVWDEESKEAMVIDPADEGVDIAQDLQRRGLKPILVAATHGHFDHLLGALDLMLIYKLPLALSKKDEFMLSRTGETAEYFLKFRIGTPNIKKIDIDLDKVISIRLGGEKIKVVETPGHTPGSVCLVAEKSGLIFTGDTLFAGGMIGDTSHQYSSIEEMRRSLRKLRELPGNLQVLAGHGETDVLENCLGDSRNGEI